MAIKFFTIPDPIQPQGLNAKFLVTGAAVQVIKGTIANIVTGDIEQQTTQEGNSYLNTPVIDRLVLPASSYTDLEGGQVDYPEISIDTVIFTVTKPRNIVKTPIQGRNGTVKEYVSDNDFQINCRGVLSSKANVIPESDAQFLRRAFETPQQIPIVSEYLNSIFDIFDIVIESWSMSQVEGKFNEIPFSFSASSDYPLDFEELV